MRIAVLGVGLIGGSIGLAAKRRLGAEVVGYDSEPGERARAASSSGRSTASASRSPRRSTAPRSSSARRRSAALPALVAEALDASGEDAVVTDVGSTKRELIEALAEDERIGAVHRRPSARRRRDARASRTRATTCSRARAGT